MVTLAKEGLISIRRFTLALMTWAGLGSGVRIWVTWVMTLQEPREPPRARNAEDSTWLTHVKFNGSLPGQDRPEHLLVLVVELGLTRQVAVAL